MSKGKRNPSRPSAGKKNSISNLDLAFRLFNEIGIISQLSNTQFERRLPLGMNRSQFSILNWFARVDDQASPGRLAKAMEVTKGAITNTLKKLEAAEWIVISADESSGRQKIVRMTSEGREARDAAIEAAGPLFLTFLESIQVEEIQRLIPELERIRKVLDESR
ncbi:MAG: DNA-binding MarR family transcriptional regulator [Candidatus Azotimanducaceae bacterium]|jgi:DNA-binding MarR family transcriptional regulator